MTPKWVILTLTYVRSVSTSSQMTLRSLSASESCLGVAGGGKGESGLGEEETHSDGFISCRLRQKAATCSVLCKSKTWTNKQAHSQINVYRIKNTHRSRTSDMDLQVRLSTSCWAGIHGCTESEPGETALKKKCTNLVYFQSFITMTLCLPLLLSHPSFSLMFYSYWQISEMIHHFHWNQNIHTYVFRYGLLWRPTLMQAGSLWTKINPTWAQLTWL